MFDIIFGWRKASKCKKLIRRVQCRLKLLKNKRDSIVRLLRQDVAQLIMDGYEENAFNRVEQLFKDESIAVVYELLDHFSEFIIIHLSYIRRHKDCPNDINEAVSSLIFASARCGDLPELRVIRKLFGERYGQRFAMAAVELYPGNLVNSQIKERLSIKSVPDDVKHRLVDEIARDCCLKPAVLALEYSSELQRQQVKENTGHQATERDDQAYYGRVKGSQMQASTVNEIEGKAVHVDISSSGKSFLTRSCNSQQDSDIICTSISSSIVWQSSQNILESPMHNKEEKVGNCSQMDAFTISCMGTKENKRTGRIQTITLEEKEEQMAAATSESVPQFPEEMVIYLDDIEEFQSPVTKGSCQDQRLFTFKSSILPKGQKIEDGCDLSYTDHYESGSEKSDTRSLQKSRKESGKRLRRLVSRESQSMKDIGCMIYYGEINKCSPTLGHRSRHHPKHENKTLVKESEGSYYAQKRLKQSCCMEARRNFGLYQCRDDPMRKCCSCCFNREMEGCSLDHPCYFCTSDDKDDWEVPAWKQKRGITTSVGFPTHDLKQAYQYLDFCNFRCSRNGEPDKEMKCTTIPQKVRRRGHDIGATMYDVFTYQDHQPNKQSKETRGKAEGSGSPGSGNDNAPNGSCLRKTSSSTRKETLPPYLRAMTMPPERPKDRSADSILRSNSCPFHYPSHVHPKLPNYDDIAAKFMALKKEHLQNKRH